jgi:hypothetical protein
MDEQGKVAGVRKVRASGLERWDALTGNAVLGFEYKPFVVDGKPMPVCSVIVFIYDQR